jgi:serine protease AprX
MKLRHLVALLIFFCVAEGNAQSFKFWVYFTDKKGVEFDPYTYFDQKAIDRRIKNGLPISDYTDFPVNENYVARVSEICDSTSYSSRWFNAVAVYAQVWQMEQIAQLPFVAGIEIMEEYEGGLTRYIKLSDFNPGQKNLLVSQTKRMGGEIFSKKQINGKGVRVAIIDAGFTGFKTCEALRHTVNRDYIIDTWDLIQNTKDVFRGHSHGTMVASCIAGKVDSVTIGLAPFVEFLLARTEKAFYDKIKEEENWVAAMEWADKNGADIINTSLGYTTRRYFRENMNGRSGLISRAATMASRKGIIVVNAAGNEGDSPWKVVTAPGDADSVLTVGGISPWTGLHASWSSYGPSSDKRMKPNVCAFGHVIVASGKGYEEQAGTSFASPLVAGFAACILQLHPDWTNWQVYDAIMKSSDLYPYYDYAHGYGVPHAKKLLALSDSTLIEKDTTFDVKEADGMIRVIIRPKFFTVAEPVQSGYFVAAAKFTKQEMEDSKPFYHPNDNVFNASASFIYTDIPDYLFYHVENRDGFLDKYYVISVHQKEVLSLNREDFSSGEIIRVFYKGYTEEIEL